MKVPSAADAAPVPNVSMPSLHLLLPGSLRDLTGGTLYDRRIVDGLRELGWRVDVHELDRSFPLPTTESLMRAHSLLGGLPDDALVVIDGLALGAMPEVVSAHAARLRLVALVHHPLALETGLDAESAARLKLSETAALAHARLVIVTSASTAALLDDYGVSRAQVRVVEPGTDPAPLASGGAHSDGTLRLVSVASVTPRKGHLALIEALGGLDRALRWRLDIAGSLERDPTTAARLRARIRELGLGERARLHGELSPEDVRGLYARGDLFVLASLFEGYGMAYAEALAHGLPILATSGGAISSTVPADAGILVLPAPEAELIVQLRDALTRLLTDAELRERLSAGARRARALLPNWPTAAARFAAVLADV